jgi:diketogulonate reductase-like aldo/keto reductase
MLMASQNGFRVIDSANQRKHYYEATVGHAVQRWLAESGHHRRELFLQSKFTHRAGQDEPLPYDPNASIALQVEQSLESSLEHIGSDYLDSLVRHGSTIRVGFANEDWEAWRAMEHACQKGKARLIGVSNVTPKQLEPGDPRIPTPVNESSSNKKDYVTSARVNWLTRHWFA